LLATLTVSSFISAVMNPDALNYGDIHLPALSARESLGSSPSGASRSSCRSSSARG
jgi:hypothetical protein